MTFRLSIGGETVGEFSNLRDVWQRIDLEYGDSDDGRYSHVVRYRVTDLKEGVSYRAAMSGGIWDACCEGYAAFRQYMYLTGWDGRGVWAA